VVVSSGASLLLPETGLEIVRGTTRTLRLEVTDADGVPYDITGARVVMSVKYDVLDPLPLIQKWTDDPLQAALIQPKVGVAEIYILPADTQNLDSNVDYLFDVWLITLSGERFVVVPPSLFRVKDTVTRIPL
jgi:hypothetical protein